MSTRLCSWLIVLLTLGACAKPVAPASAEGSATTSTDAEDAPWRCETQTCEQLDFECGAAFDSCGAELQCGSCDGSKVCHVGQCLPPAKIRHERVTNPYTGATPYVKARYAQRVKDTIRYAPAELHRSLNLMSTMPTAIWLERIAAIHGTPEGASLREHLDDALRQQARAQMAPTVVTVVVYNLPDRDCAAGASAGELRLEEEGLRRYKEDFIDPIASIVNQPEYRSLRVVTILEPDSLPNLVTNLESHEACRTAAPAYREGITYAIKALSRVSNAYLYLDIAHSGWMGWDNPAKAAKIYREVMQDAGGADLVSGFATNISNYTPLAETIDPFLVPDAYGALVEGFYGWNRVIDEHTYADKLLEQFPDHGVLIDTGRNGWGSRKGDVPRDGRHDRGNWCNVRDAGLGARPQADPRPGVHAYLWVKPPGESDGAGDPSVERPGVPYDWMCSPNLERPTDAMPDAPAAGDWFIESLFSLIRNADPAL